MVVPSEVRALARPDRAPYRRDTLKEERKTMKKALALLFALALIGTLAACAAPTATTAPTSAPTATPTLEPPYEVVIELINYGMDIPDLGVIEQKVNEISLPKTNTTIKFKPVAVADQFMKLSLWVAANEKVDLAMTGITTNPGNLVAQGCLQPITDLVHNSPTIMSLMGDYLAAGTFKGEIYAVPGIAYPAAGMSYLYRSDLATQYSITVPAHVNSLLDLEPIFAAVKASGMAQYATSLGDGKNQTTSMMDNSFDPLGDPSYETNGVIMLNDTTNTIVDIFETQAYHDRVLKLRDWYNKGYVDTLSYSNGYSTHDSLANDTAFGFVAQIGAGSNVAYWTGSTGKPLAECTIGEKTISAGGAMNMSWGVATTSERPDKAIQFLELMFSDVSVANLLNYGIEGTHYVRVDGTTQVIRYPDGKNAFNCGYGTFINWYGDTKKTWVMQPLDDKFIASLDGFTKAGGAKMLASFGYSFDSTNVKTELTAITAVVDQYRSPLEAGVVADVEGQYQAFVQALKDANIAKVIAENQTQLNAWLATK